MNNSDKMRPREVIFILLLYLWNKLRLTDANAMLKPTHRGVMWTRGNYNSGGYNYMGINCGGIARFKNNDGRCGLCGDAFNGPRHHETGGKYATGTVSEVIERGERNLHVNILLNSDQGGYFEFRLCESNGTAETQVCFDKHLLKITEGRLQGDEFAYVVERAGMIPLTVEIPERVYCEKCVLQWKYVTGNTFGRDEHGIACLGCGPQETYVNCADITIKGWEMPATLAPFAPTEPPVPSTMPWTTSTAAPTTTMSPPLPPSTRAPATTANRQTQITRVKPTQNTHAYKSRSRQAVTDADEGSRRRSGYGNEKYSNAYAPVVAPRQTPAVLPPSQQQAVPTVPAPVKSLPTPVKTVPAVQTVATVTQPPPTMQNRQENKVASAPVKEAKRIVNRERRRNVPFKIPRPPQLSNEQIDALNNNKNVLPHHDPLQKYVKVGSSKIIAAVDFTTMRAHQVQTPPTLTRNEMSRTRSTISTTNSAGRKSGTNQNSPEVFTSFGNEMLGVPVRYPAARKQSLENNLMNEYSIAADTGASLDTSRQKVINDQRSNPQRTTADLFSEFAFDTNADVINSNNRLSSNANSNTVNNKNRMFSNANDNVANSYNRMFSNVNDKIGSNKHRPFSQANKQYGPSVSSRDYGREPSHLYSGKQQIPLPTSQQKQIPNQENKSSLPNRQSRYQGSDLFGTSGNRQVYPEPAFSASSESQRSVRLQSYNTGQHAFEYKSDTSLFGGDVNAFENKMDRKQNTFYSGQKLNSQNNQMSVKDSALSHFGKTYQEPVVTNRQFSSNINEIREANVHNSGSSYTPYHAQNQPPFGMPDRNAYPGKSRTTKLPVVDTSTHRSKYSPSNNIASRLKLPKNPSANLDAQKLPNMPVNLFKDKERNSFKAPVVFERFTNYQIGEGRTNQSTASNTVERDSNFQKQVFVQASNTSSPYENIHLNTGIHSPQYIFGQDHYLAHDVELSVPAFGGPETQNLQTQQELNLGHHETPKAHGSLQSYKNEHLNFAIHSPENYFPHESHEPYQGNQANQANLPLKMTSQKTKPDLIYDRLQGVSNYNILPSAKLPTLESWKKTPAATTKQTVTPKTPTAPTTNVLDYQMKELNNLRKKLERLQNLINQKSEGFQAGTVTTSNIIQNDIPNQNKDNMYLQAQHAGFKPEIASSKPETVNPPVPPTVNPGINKETTKYINAFKTQMLQSIKDANAKKWQTSVTLSKNAFSTKAYSGDTANHVTPTITSGDQQSEKNKAYVSKMPEGSQGQAKKQKNNRLKMREQDQKNKYIKLLELLIKRRKQKQINSLQKEVTSTIQASSQAPVSKQQQHHDHLQLNNLRNKQNNFRQVQQSEHQSQDQKNWYQQNLQKTSTLLPTQPSLAEIQIPSTKRQRILQRLQTLSNRQVEIQQTPTRTTQKNDNQKSSSKVNSNSYKPTAVKTTIDKLADRIAIRMAEKMKSGSQTGLPNFKVVPLSSDSVMATLRNIAISVLNDKNFRNEIPDTLPRDKQISMPKPTTKSQLEGKPSAKEMHMSQNVQKQNIININDLTTANRNNKASSTSHKTTTTASRSPTLSPLRPPASQERLTRRQELIRKMKQLMLRRQQAQNENTLPSNTKRPTTNPQIGPFLPDQSAAVSNKTLQSNNNRPVHIMDNPNNDRPSIYHKQTTSNHNVIPTAQKTTTGRNINTSVTAKSLQNAKYIQGDSDNNISKLSPDIARSMLIRVREMLSKKKRFERKAPSVKADPKTLTQDVLVMPLSKDVLYKLLQSMQKQKTRSGT